MRNLFRRAKPKRYEIRIPTRKYQALIGAAAALAHDLEEVINEANHQAAQAREGGLRQTDIEHLVDRCVKISGNAKNVLEQEDMTETGDTVWDADGHSRYVAPSAALLTVPDSAVGAMTKAVELGARSARLLHELMVAELSIGLARWRVVTHANIQAQTNTTEGASAT